MKKIHLILITTLLCFAFITACGKGESEIKPGGAETKAESKIGSVTLKDSRTPITAAKFEEFAKQSGYEIYTIALENGASVVAKNSDETLEFQFSEFADHNAATDTHEYLVSISNIEKPSTVTGENYEIVYGTGYFADDIVKYKVYTRIENTSLNASSTKDNQKEADEFLTLIGYNK